MRLLLGGSSSSCTDTAQSWQPFQRPGLTSNRLYVHSPLTSHLHGACPRRRHLDLCWQWRSEESDRAALDRRLGLEGLTSSAAFAGIESAGKRCTYLDMQL